MTHMTQYWIKPTPKHKPPAGWWWIILIFFIISQDCHVFFLIVVNFVSCIKARRDRPLIQDINCTCLVFAVIGIFGFLCCRTITSYFLRLLLLLNYIIVKVVLHCLGFFNIFTLVFIRSYLKIVLWYRF